MVLLINWGRTGECGPGANSVWYCPKSLIKAVKKSLTATRLNLLHSVFQDNCFVGRVELFKLAALRINYFNKKDSLKTSFLLNYRKLSLRF